MTTNPFQNLIPIVGVDFVDAQNVRAFSFSLCERTEKGLSSVAIVDIHGGKVTRNMTIGALTHFRKEVEAIAFAYLERSVHG